MECKTIKRVKKDGKPIIVNKKKYKTLYDAQIAANSINIKPKIYIKRVVYQCTQCEFFHVGTSSEMLDNKKMEKPKWYGPRSIRVNVIGTIDLSQFDKKGLSTDPSIILQRKTIREKNDILLKNKKENRLLKRQKQREKILKNKDKPIVGDFKNIKYYMKLKTVKLILTNGDIKFIKFSKICVGEIKIPDRKTILNYLTENY